MAASPAATHRAMAAAASTTAVTDHGSLRSRPGSVTVGSAVGVAFGIGVFEIGTGSVVDGGVGSVTGR